MGRDSLNSWLRSVAEAKRHQDNFRASLTKIKGIFKVKLRSSPHASNHGSKDVHRDSKDNSDIEPPPSVTLKLHEVDHG